MTQEAVAISQIRSFRNCYPLDLDARYELLNERKSRLGRTVSLSSSELVFEPGESLPVGSRINLSISWPVALNGKVALCLCISGTIVENRAKCATVAILRYDFRTKGSAHVHKFSASDTSSVCHRVNP